MARGDEGKGPSSMHRSSMAVWSSPEQLADGESGAGSEERTMKETMLGCCYRSPDQGEKTDFKQLE